MMNDQALIAVVGADGLLGEALLAELADSGWPASRLRALVAEEAVGTRLEYADTYLKSVAAADFDFADVAVALFADAELTAQSLPQARAAGARLLDLSGHLATTTHVPVVVHAVNDAELGAQTALIAPPAVVVAAARVVAALQPLAGVERIDLTWLRAVSNDGRAGIDELARQTANLLNARPIEPHLYPQQIAFNVLPGWDGFDATGYTAEETLCSRLLAEAVGVPSECVTALALRMPVFFGDGCVLRLRLMRGVPCGQLQRALEASAGLDCLALDDAPVSPVVDAVSQSLPQIALLRAAAGEARDLNLWIVADNVRAAASNGVAVARTLVDGPR